MHDLVLHLPVKVRCQTRFAVARSMFLRPNLQVRCGVWASCAAVVLRANVHKISRSNGAGMLHAVMYPSRTAHTVVVAKETRAFPTMFF